jgi:hypothetical protein
MKCKIHYQTTLTSNFNYKAFLFYYRNRTVQLVLKLKYDGQGPPCYRDSFWLGRACRAGGASVTSEVAEVKGGHEK